AKRERQQPLLLQVTFVDAGEAADNDRHTTKKPRRQSGVFAAAALAVVVIANDDPLQAMHFIVPGDLPHGLSALTRNHILSLASLIREGIGGAHEHIIAELI